MPCGSKLNCPSLTGSNKANANKPTNEKKRTKTMSKTKKITSIIVTAMVMVTILTTAAFAQSYANKYVYGNAYTVVANGGFSDGGANYLTTTVGEIYKADGTSSNYSRVRGDVLNSSGNQISVSTNVALDLDTPTLIMLNQNYAAGTIMKLRMKGNVNSLDCIVDFTTAIG